MIFRIVFQNNEVQDLVLDLNVFEQLFKESELADGNIIDKGYSRNTGEANQGGSFNLSNSKGESFSRKKEQGDPYFLLDTGDFYKSFKVKVLDDSFVIIAETIKEDGTDLLKYGDLLGLTNESKAKIIKEIIPFVIQETRKIIRG